MLCEARRVRPDLWVYAELFTGDQETDLHFERQLGINALIRECLQPRNMGDLVWQLKLYGGREAVGELDSRPAFLQLPPAEAAAPGDAAGRTTALSTAAAGGLAAAAAQRGGLLRPLPVQLCPALLYDCTHDNEPASKVFTPALTLPLAAVVAGASTACGSTRGTDELVPYNLSVVRERRLYNDFHPEIPLRDPATTLERSAAALMGGAQTPEAPKEEEEQTIEITWEHGGNEVVLRGEWDGWEQDVKMERLKPEGGGFSCLLRANTHFMKKQGDQKIKTESVQFKYIVDGKWMVDESKPTEYDANGNRNNVATLPGTQHRGSFSTLGQRTESTVCFDAHFKGRYHPSSCIYCSEIQMTYRRIPGFVIPLGFKA